MFTGRYSLCICSWILNASVCRFAPPNPWDRRLLLHPQPRHGSCLAALKALSAHPGAVFWHHSWFSALFSSYSVQPRTKDFVEYRNLPNIKEFSKYINEKRKEIGATIDEIENKHKSRAPHHWFNGESFPTKDDYLWLKKLIGLDKRYDKQMTTILKKSSEKKFALMPPIGGKKHVKGKGNINPTYSGNQPEWSEYGRNKRTVWTINPKPFKEAHFAVYPEELCETPISAGCPKEGIVLDPFFGSGTTGLVALKQNKRFIGIELNEEYIEIAKKRLKPYLEQKKLWSLN